MINYKKITSTITEIQFDDEVVGHVELIGDMYAIEVYYMPLNLPKKDKRLVKGIVERLVKTHKAKVYKKIVMLYELRNSKMYGKKYVEFFVLD